MNAVDQSSSVDSEQSDQRGLLLAGQVMNGVLDHVFDVHGRKKGDLPLDVAFRRFVCVAWLLRPELMDHISLAQLAPHLGVTRAALSKMTRNFGDTYGLRNVLQKRESARAIYSEAQKRDHWRVRRKKQEEAEALNAETGDAGTEVGHE